MPLGPDMAMAMGMLPPGMFPGAAFSAGMGGPGQAMMFGGLAEMLGGPAAFMHPQQQQQLLELQLQQQRQQEHQQQQQLAALLASQPNNPVALAAALTLQQQQQQQQQVKALQQAQQKVQLGPAACSLPPITPISGPIAPAAVASLPLQAPQPKPLPTALGQGDVLPAAAAAVPAAAPAAPGMRGVLEGNGIQVRVLASGQVAPATWRKNASGHQTQTQAAQCVGPNAMAIADGVALGLPFGAYAQALASSCVQLAEAALARSQTGGPVLSLRDVIVLAQERMGGVSGAASLVLVCVDRERSILHAATMGPCGFVLLRPNSLTGEMEPVSAWRPFTDTSSKARYLTTRDMQPILGGLPATAVTDEIMQVAPGDVLIVGSHGLFDMVWLHGGPSTNLRRELYTLAYAGAEKTDPQLVAGQLIGLATNMATNGLVGTPLAQQLAKEGRVLTPATDIGDNAAIVSYLLPV